MKNDIKQISNVYIFIFNFKIIYHQKELHLINKKKAKTIYSHINKNIFY